MAEPLTNSDIAEAWGSMSFEQRSAVQRRDWRVGIEWKGHDILFYKGENNEVLAAITTTRIHPVRT